MLLILYKLMLLVVFLMLKNELIKIRLVMIFFICVSWIVIFNDNIFLKFYFRKLQGLYGCNLCIFLMQYCVNVLKEDIGDCKWILLNKISLILGSCFVILLRQFFVLFLLGGSINNVGLVLFLLIRIYGLKFLIVDDDNEIFFCKLLFFLVLMVDV